MVTPAGVIESRRLPGSGAGPSPDRLMIGSEGALGVITEAWLRLQDRPTFRAGAALAFDDFLAGAGAVRAVAQAGLYPSNLRLVDAEECLRQRRQRRQLRAAGPGVRIGRPSGRRLAGARARAGPGPRRAAAAATTAPAAGLAHRLHPHALQRARSRCRPAIIADTFETAITWDRFEAFHGAVKGATEQAIREATGRPGVVTCRFTHVYPDGPAPYFTLPCARPPGRAARALAAHQAARRRTR